MKKVIIIGSGFSSLSAACYLAKQGYEVTVFEKNKTLGGRARQFTREGFTFDIGPTFYWMPDVFEKFFSDFGRKASDFYDLVRLNPGYEVYFGRHNSVSLPAGLEEVIKVFEEKEKGSGLFLEKFMRQACFNYKVAMDKVVYKPGKSPLELIMPATVSRLPQFYYSLGSVIEKNIKDPQLRQILEFPVLFLGARASNIPAFYCFMNYADMVLGTWHIQGGMYKLVEAMAQLALSLGVDIQINSPVERIISHKKEAKGVIVDGEFVDADVIVSGADYHHTEQLLDEKYRNYSEPYWEKRVLAPSALLYYIAFNKKVENISHHTLFFDSDFDGHAGDIYDTPAWPSKPLFYASFPSKTDASVAPEGKETAIILIPVAPGLEDTREIREKYFRQVISRMENLTSQSLKNDVLFYESYAINDFIRDYNAYKGNAYGLANTLFQTAFLKPKVYNRNLDNLFYTGQLTVPGPGVPTTIISGKIAAGMATDYFKER